jgi:hypothetical protein
MTYISWVYKGVSLSEKQMYSFWDRVNVLSSDPDAYWYWKDGNNLSQGGYGRVNFSHHIFHSNQLAYLFLYGNIDDGKIILHSPECVSNAERDFGDGKISRKCCNPFHLRQGTYKENSEDTKSQGRMKGTFEKGCLPANAGDKSNFAKLSKEQALSIKNDTRPTKEISKEYGVSNTLVTRIKAGTRWRILSAIG